MSHISHFFHTHNINIGTQSSTKGEVAKCSLQLTGRGKHLMAPSFSIIEGCDAKPLTCLCLIKFEITTKVRVEPKNHGKKAALVNFGTLTKLAYSTC
jgi:hypothetical protein